MQQILYENPDLEIVITDAGKSSDGGYIVYKIRTGVYHYGTEAKRAQLTRAGH